MSNVFQRYLEEAAGKGEAISPTTIHSEAVKAHRKLADQAYDEGDEDASNRHNRLADYHDRKLQELRKELRKK